MNTPDSVNTIPALLDDRVARYGNREFLRFEDASFGFEDLRDASRSVAAGLQALGLTKGDKVALLMSNRPEFLFSWFALAMLGAVEVPVNTAHKGSLLRYMLEQADCRFLIVDSALYAQLERIPGDLELLEQVIVLDDLPQSDCGKPLISFETLQRADSAALPEINAADPVAIMFTSGTTGPSKGAVVPQQYPLSMGRIVAWSGDYNDEDCLYNALPLFHGNAQFLSTLPALLSGARMVLAKRFSPSSFWEDVKRYGCTDFNYIGGILPILMKAEPKPDDADNPLRVMVGAGAPADLSAAFEKRFGLQLVEAYGMSEIGIPMTNTLHKRKLGTCGFQHPDYDVFLQADDGSEAGVDEPGELLIRPKKFNGMMLEYYRMPEKTVEAWSNLWFHTGDYLKRDADGWFYFVDRKKDALRRRGENISSYEVEREINAHPAVLESAAIAVKSELGEDELMVVVCRKPGATLDAEALIAHCQDKMAYFMVPRYLRFVDAMPKTPTERIQKFKLRSEGVTVDTFDREAGTQR